jgi:low temperature requirement protein LtrA
VERALDSGGVSVPLVAIGAAALVLVFALWWLYFLHPAGEALVMHRERSYLWGYGHYGVLAALAAIGAGLELAVERTGHSVAASPIAVGYAIAIPVAVFLLLTWALHAPITPRPLFRPGSLLGCCVLVLVVPAFADRLGVLAVVASIATICALLLTGVLVRLRAEPA